MSSSTKAAVVDTLPALFPDAFPGHGEHPPLELGALGGWEQGQVRDRLTTGDFDAWSEALAKVGNCARPVRLHGRSTTIDASTGEVVSEYFSSSEPLGITHVRCGSRRESECPRVRGCTPRTPST